MSGEQTAFNVVVPALSGYRLGPILGSGSFGEVRVAVDKHTHKKAAIKFINKRGVSDVSSVERISREFFILTALNHRNVIRLYEVCQDASYLYLVMEFAGAGTLDTVLPKDEPMPEEDVRYLFQQIVSAVKYCHRQHVVHRDLKPENILLSKSVEKHSALRDLEVKIADFGLSNSTSHGVRARSPVGTPLFNAPEVLFPQMYPSLFHDRSHEKSSRDAPDDETAAAADEHGKGAAAAQKSPVPSAAWKDLNDEAVLDVSGKVLSNGNPSDYSGTMVDIWSMGVILYRMLVGKLPFPAQNMKQLKQMVFKPVEFPKDVCLSRPAIDLLQRMLQLDPFRRPGADDVSAHPWMTIGNSLDMLFSHRSEASVDVTALQMSDLGPIIVEESLSRPASAMSKREIFAAVGLDTATSSSNTESAPVSSAPSPDAPDQDAGAPECIGKPVLVVTTSGASDEGIPSQPPPVRERASSQPTFSGDIRQAFRATQLRKDVRTRRSSFAGVGAGIAMVDITSAPTSAVQHIPRAPATMRAADTPTISFDMPLSAPDANKLPGRRGSAVATISFIPPSAHRSSSVPTPHGHASALAPLDPYNTKASPSAGLPKASLLPSISHVDVTGDDANAPFRIPSIGMTTNDSVPTPVGMETINMMGYAGTLRESPLTVTPSSRPSLIGSSGGIQRTLPKYSRQTAPGSVSGLTPSAMSMVLPKAPEDSRTPMLTSPPIPQHNSSPPASSFSASATTASGSAPVQQRGSQRFHRYSESIEVETPGTTPSSIVAARSTLHSLPTQSSTRSAFNDCVADTGNANNTSSTSPQISPESAVTTPMFDAFMSTGHIASIVAHARKESGNLSSVVDEDILTGNTNDGLNAATVARPGTRDVSGALAAERRRSSVTLLPLLPSNSVTSPTNLTLLPSLTSGSPAITSPLHPLAPLSQAAPKPS